LPTNQTFQLARKNRKNNCKISKSVLFIVCLTRLKSFSVSSFQQTASFSISHSRKMSISATNLNDVCLDNPLLHTFTKNYGIPPFAEITASHYKGAFETAFVEHEAELKAIVDNKEVPSFENTLLAFDRSGSLLTKVGKVYYNLCSSMCPPGMNQSFDFLRAYSTHNSQLSYCRHTLLFLLIQLKSCRLFNLRWLVPSLLKSARPTCFQVKINSHFHKANALNSTPDF
jgi:hypothetical protein